MNRADKDQPDNIRAGQLSAEHVGELIRFREYDQDREINRIVTAELRQIHHNGGERSSSSTTVAGTERATGKTSRHTGKTSRHEGFNGEVAQ